MITLKRNQIEDAKWNACIANSSLPRIYGLTWYLDSVCGEWWGIAEEDYSAVFPVPIARKWKLIPWVAQPPFCQQLGVFASHPYPYSRILKKLWYYPKIHLHFQPSQTLSLPQKRNSLLPLHKPYQTLHQNYSTLRKRELKKVLKQNLKVLVNENISQSLTFWLSEWKKKPFFRTGWENVLSRLIHNAQQHHRLLLISAMRGEQIVGVSLFLKDFGRILYLGGTSIQAGVSTLIFDHVIQTFADQALYLDFEGSTIPSIQQFYESWGELQYEYYYEFKRVWGFKRNNR